MLVLVLKLVVVEISAFSGTTGSPISASRSMRPQLQPRQGALGVGEVADRPDGAGAGLPDHGRDRQDLVFIGRLRVVEEVDTWMWYRPGRCSSHSALSRMCATRHWVSARRRRGGAPTPVLGGRRVIVGGSVPGWLIGVSRL